MSEKLEPGAISRLRAWKEEETVKIKQRKDALGVQLRMAVPVSFSRWLGEAGLSVIEDLIEYGRASRKYRRSDADGRLYGFTDLSEFLRRFKELEVAWKEVVRVSTNWDGTDRFEVYFFAI